MPIIYSRLSIVLHWLMAVLMVAGFLIGEQLEDLPRGPEKTQVISIHAVIGVSVFVFLLLRIAALHINGPQRGPAVDWKDKAARLGHLALYGVMLVLPLSGGLMMMIGRAPFSPFGLVTFPYFGEFHDLREIVEGVHVVAAKLFMLLLIIHVAAVVWHQKFLKDDVAARMLPFLRRT